MLILVPFFVVHYVSHFDYGSDYYSSSYSGIFWPVFHVISDSGSFQPPSSMPPLAYANYAMGSPQVGFFFRVEPPIICILYMFGVHSGVCFLLLGADLDDIFTYGGSTIRVCTLATLWSLPLAAICETLWWSMSTPGMHQVAAPSATLGRVEPLLLILLCPNHLVGYTALGSP